MIWDLRHFLNPLQFLLNLESRVKSTAIFIASLSDEAQVLQSRFAQHAVVCMDTAQLPTVFKQVRIVCTLLLSLQSSNQFRLVFVSQVFTQSELLSQ